MATGQALGPDPSFGAAADLSGMQYTVVRLSAANRVNAHTSPLSLDVPISGILQNKPNAVGKGAAVRRYGRTPMTAGEAIVAGAEVSFNSSGRALTANSVFEWRIGTAVTAANADGSVFEVDLDIQRVGSLGALF